MENCPPWDANSSLVKKFRIYLKPKRVCHKSQVPPPNYLFKTHYHPIYNQVVKPAVRIYFLSLPPLLHVMPTSRGWSITVWEYTNHEAHQQYAAISSLLLLPTSYAQIFFSAPCSHTLTVTLPIVSRDQDSQLHKTTDRNLISRTTVCFKISQTHFT